jgi:hypothetical protein
VDRAMMDMGKVIFAFTVSFAANMVTWVSAIAQVDIDQYGGEALGALAIYGGLIAALKILWSEMKAERDARIAAEQRAVVIAEAMSAKLEERLTTEIADLKSALREEAEQKAEEQDRHIDAAVDRKVDEAT